MNLIFEILFAVTTLYWKLAARRQGTRSMSGVSPSVPARTAWELDSALYTSCITYPKGRAKRIRIVFTLNQWAKIYRFADELDTYLTWISIDRVNHRTSCCRCGPTNLGIVLPRFDRVVIDWHKLNIITAIRARALRNNATIYKNVWEYRNPEATEFRRCSNWKWPSKIPFSDFWTRFECYSYIQLALYLYIYKI